MMYWGTYITRLTQLTICGDINMNYLTENENKTQLNLIINAYNLQQVIDFPARIFKDKIAQLDNMFLDEGSINRVSVCSIQNGLSEHEAQFLVLDRTLIVPPLITKKHRKKVNK
jgi:hypothetical protein